MKTLTSILISLTFLAITATNASAQDDDGLFGDDETGDDGSSDDGMTDDGMSDGSSDDGASDTSTTADAAVAGGVGKNSGQLGLGFALTTQELAGVEAEYWLSPTLMATGIGRITIISGEGDADFTNLQIGAGAMIVLKERGKAAVLFGGRFILGYASFGDASETSIAIEAPLRLQMAVHDNISLHVEGGLALLIGGQVGLQGDPTVDFGLGVGTNNAFGEAGFTFYF